MRSMNVWLEASERRWAIVWDDQKRYHFRIMQGVGALFAGRMRIESDRLLCF